MSGVEAFPVFSEFRLLGVGASLFTSESLTAEAPPIPATQSVLSELTVDLVLRSIYFFWSAASVHHTSRWPLAQLNACPCTAGKQHEDKVKVAELGSGASRGNWQNQEHRCARRPEA